ncbi:MAG: penicillin-binding protein 2 [Chloroflexi bacterium]|nr:penicillin-binding protein 2 [Chloroflexota bacterium]
MSMLGEGFRGTPGTSRNRPHGNLTALKLAVILLFSILVARLGYMQIINGDAYAQRSRENHITATNILPPRGLIVDRNGQPLVNNVGIYSATIVPELLPEGEAVRYAIYQRLEQLLGVPALEIRQRVLDAEAERRAHLELPIKKYLTKAQALQLEEVSTDMPGVSLTITPGREYIAGSAFSHILGFVGAQTPEERPALKKQGYAINEPVGKDGIEAWYEDELRGDIGLSATERDAQGHLIQALKTKDPVAGNSLTLAIDAGLQEFVAQLLEDSLESAGTIATTAAAVVMSPKTGQVYALVSLPTFDNNLFARPDERGQEYQSLLDDPRKPFLNRALTAEAPGSTFKLVTASAGLQNGNLTTSSNRTVTSTILEIKGENGVIYPFTDWRAHGYVDFYTAIAWSSNHFFYQASCGIPQEGIRGMGKNSEESAAVLAHYARGFGFGQGTGIDLFGEGDGIVPTPDWKRRLYAGPQFNENDRDWFYADTCFMGIGQGDVTATPIQVARMTAAVANGGKLLTPRIVKDVVSPDGTVKELKPEWKQVPVDAKNLAEVRKGMLLSVNDGAGQRAYIPGLGIAGKTGTAEFGPVLANGKQAQHAWFTGFAPYDDPEVVVTVYFDLGVGGDKAAPVAARIFQYFAENVTP